MFTYTASGTILTKSCATWAFLPLKLFIVSFKPGDIAWLNFRAKKGILERIYIKKMKVIYNERTMFSVSKVIYFDNTNAAFNEEELVTELEAVNLAKAYYSRQLTLSQKLICKSF